MTAVSMSGVWLGSFLIAFSVAGIAVLIAWRRGVFDRLVESVPDEHALWPDGADESLVDALARFDPPPTVVDSRFATIAAAEREWDMAHPWPERTP